MRARCCSGGTGELPILWTSSAFRVVGPLCMSVQVGPYQGPTRGGGVSSESSSNSPCQGEHTLLAISPKR